MPSSSAFCTAGPMAEASCARMISAFAPCEIRLSTSVSCLAADDWASAEMYLSPLASRAFLMAASSVFQRSSWKLDQDTPTILSFACATDTSVMESAAPARMAAVNFFMISSLRRVWRDLIGTDKSVPALKLFFELRKNTHPTSENCQQRFSRPHIFFAPRNKQ